MIGLSVSPSLSLPPSLPPTRGAGDCGIVSMTLHTLGKSSASSAHQDVFGKETLDSFDSVS